MIHTVALVERRGPLSTPAATPSWGIGNRIRGCRVPKLQIKGPDKRRDVKG